MAAARLRSWLRGVFARRRVEREMADEMAFHLAARAEHWARQGAVAGRGGRGAPGSNSARSTATRTTAVRRAACAGSTSCAPT